MIYPLKQENYLKSTIEYDVPEEFDISKLEAVFISESTKLILRKK